MWLRFIINFTYAVLGFGTAGLALSLWSRVSEGRKWMLAFAITGSTLWATYATLVWMDISHDVRTWAVRLAVGVTLVSLLVGVLNTRAVVRAGDET